MKAKRKSVGKKPASRQRAKKSPKEGYDVGYARPPKDTQFLSGQSGNPRGRPRRSRNKRTLMKEMIEKMLAQQVEIRVGKEVRRVTMMEAVGASIVNRATKSGPGVKELMDWCDILGITRDEEVQDEYDRYGDGLYDEEFAWLAEKYINRGWLQPVEPESAKLGYPKKEERPSFKVLRNNPLFQEQQKKEEET